MISSFCSHCFKPLEFPCDRANQRETCPHCKKPVRVGPRELPDGQSHPLPLGGWLMCPAIGFILAPLWIVGDIKLLYTITPKNAGNVALATPGLAIDIIYLILRVVTVVPFFILLVVTAVLFFSRSRYAPAAMITLLVANVVLTGVLTGMPGSVGPMLGADLAGPILVACVWIPYWSVSKRVKVTFLR